MFANRREIKENELGILKEGCYLWVWDAHARPPHIGLSVHGKYYSLRFTQKDNHSIDLAIEKVGRLPISFLWVQVDPSSLKKDPEIVFAQYSSCLDQNLSCLQPLLDCFGMEDRNFILKDLLQNLQEKMAIGNILSYRLDESWKGLATYTNQEVQSNLDAAKRRLCIK